MIAKADILSSVENLPVLGISFARLSALNRDESSEISDYVKVIESDPALMSNLLRAANSAEFGLTRQVSSASQAVAVLGTRRILNLALAMAFHGVLPGTLAGYGIDADSFWKHCIAVGVLAEELGRTLGMGNEEENFIGGLLHDIGKLVLSTYLARESKNLARFLGEGNLPFVEAEREVLGLDHCEVGVAAAEKWDLPRGLCLVARWHHQPSAVEEGEGEEGMEFLQEIVDVVHIADCLAHSFGYGTDIGELSRDIDPGAMMRTGVSAALMEKVVSMATMEIEKRIQALGKDEGG